MKADVEILDVSGTPIGHILPNEYECERGNILYELSNHLGNVLAVVSDRKIGNVSGGVGNWDHYEVSYSSFTDYYPFGMQIEERSWTTPSVDYKYGFNEQEMDNEVKGAGNSLDFGARIYDTRLGKFMTMDPDARNATFQSTYSFASNSPLFLIDINGESGKAYKTGEINEKTGRPIIKVVVNINLYGNVTSDTKSAIESDLNSQWNRSGNYFSSQAGYGEANDGQVYDVVFEFKVEIGDNNTLETDIVNAKQEDNFVYIGEGIKDELTPDGGSGSRDNLIVIAEGELNEVPSTLPHEINHGLEGNGHGTSRKTNIKPGQPVPISVPNGGQYADGTPIDYSDRVVTQDDINAITIEMNFDKNGEANVGSVNRNYKPTNTGFEKIE